MNEPKQNLPVVLSNVKRTPPRAYAGTGALLAVVVMLGVFLLTSPYWLDDEPWFVGEWRGPAEHPLAGNIEERIELRLTGSSISGSASYRGVRRTIESATLSDEQLVVVTRGRERVGNQQVELVYRYTLEPGDTDSLRVSVTVSGGFRVEPTLHFEARRP